MKLSALVASAAALGAAVGGAALATRVRRQAPQVQRVAPELRTPLLYLLPDRFDGTPPRRGGIAATLTERLTPTGLGVPVTLPSREGAPAVSVYVYEAAGRPRPSGAVVWIHGGGMITGAPWMDHALCSRLARELGVLVVSVDYRLAPEDPFPAGLDDCFTALTWVHEHAADLGVDPARIAVGGESAGGGLAAMLSQMAHDRGVPVAFQALVYPMLDDRTVLRADDEHRGELLWTPAHNASAWEWVLGHPVRADESRPYAAAARREDLSGLPPAWIGVGDIDLFYLEDVDYAHRLEAAGVPVELVVVPGMPHALDVAVWKPQMRQFRASMIEAVGRAVGAPSPS